MTNKYKSTYKSMFDVLNHIDNFETIINRIQQKYSGYSYTINFKKNKDDYNVEITLTNDNEPNSNVSKKELRTYGVL